MLVVEKVISIRLREGERVCVRVRVCFFFSFKTHPPISQDSNLRILSERDDLLTFADAMSEEEEAMTKGKKW